MGALINRRNVVVLLFLLAIVAALAVGSLSTAPAPTVRGSPPALPNLQTLPPLKFGEEADEIDPEACLTTILKIIEGPILVGKAVIPPKLKAPAGESVVREQTIVQIIQACNVDDEIRPPNLERELDVDIEVFSIICEKLSDLSADAVCREERVDQGESVGSGGSIKAAPASEPDPAPEPPPASPPE